jgi:hypothetical protein
VYWRNALKKLLKVGMEFEFNLPEKKNGTCKGNSDTCPCSKLSSLNTCWQKCTNNADCPVVKPSPETCVVVTDTCDPEDCAKCEHFESECAGIFCPTFVSHCYVCSEYSAECESCAYRYDPNKNPSAIRKSLNDHLQPNNTYGQVSDSGVHSIVPDGSLLGDQGAEIITVGRRVDYWEFFKMASNIFKLAVSKGAYFNERCSIHMHVLASYYGKLTPSQEKMGIPIKVNEMEKDLPEIVLANLHQLVRRYQNAMTWMVMGLDEPERMTRWEKFRVSVIPVSAVVNHMRDVRREVAALSDKSKYGWINYKNIEFSDSNDIHRFHVEFRAADGLFSPSAIAAIGCMYYALVIKAVEISRYGLAEVGDHEWLELSQRAKATILNNMGSYQSGNRFGDTSKIGEYQDLFVAEALDLVRQLKSILINIGPAYEVLEKLAEKPCALRRCSGETWEQIESDLAVIVNEEGKFERALAEIITLNQIAECRDEVEWVGEVGRVLRENPELAIDPDNAEVEDNIREFVNKNKEEGRMVWSSRIGAPIMI